MDPQQALGPKKTKRSKPRAVDSSTDDSSAGEKTQNLGSSRLHLIRDPGATAQTEPASQPPKETSIARAIKRKFGFFRKSAADKKPAVPQLPDTPEREANRQPPTLDVVVDVHCENQESRAEEASTDLIEERLVDGSSEDEKIGGAVLREEGGGADGHRRRRWNKSEEVVEDPKKPRRRQWAKEGGSAQIRDTTGKKIVVPKRAATAESAGVTGPPKSLTSSKPVAAPRVKSLPKRRQSYDNDGFSSDHDDEVLRIETVDNESPLIKMGCCSDASEKEEEEEEEIKEYVGESTDTSNAKSRVRLLADHAEEGAPTRRRKSPVDRRSADDEDEEQATVLDARGKRSKKSSSNSSRAELIPTNFFAKRSSDDEDETTISTNEEMHRESRRSSRHSKPSSRHEEEDNDDGYAKRKTTSSSTRNSAEGAASPRKTLTRSRTRERSKSKTKKRKKKKKKRPKEGDEEGEVKYVSVRVHKCDMLEADCVTKHPLVRVHLVYEDSGSRVQQRNNNGAEGGGDALRPALTEKFDFKRMRSMVPVWEEDLVFEMNYRELFAGGKDSVLMLFEVLDLPSSAQTTTSSSDYYMKDSCWHKVAWAFLRPVGVGGARHVDKKCRLQLYRPKKGFRRLARDDDKCEVYKWWRSTSKDKYPSSLYVSVTGVEPPKLEPVLYEQLLESLPPERRNEPSDGAGTRDEVAINDPPKWTRLAAQSCQIPNEIYEEIEAGDNGCFFLAFSNDGKFLACALSEEYEFPINVYKVRGTKVNVQFSGHKNFIYSLNWSRDDCYLLSVSSDQTAKVWDVREKIIEPIFALPHPSYVYCGKFAPKSSSSVIVTGCYDHVARVWARSRSTRRYELVQELEAHESFVNAVCFHEGGFCLTADGLGCIVVWSMRGARPKSPNRREWQMARKIKIRELEGVPINGISMHPLGSRLLVHSRNNGLRLVDFWAGSIVKQFDGLENQRIQITGCISPCGGLLFCGGEDCTLKVWGIESGKLLATYELGTGGQSRTVTCVDYHPYDHALAFTSYGSSPVLARILKFDRDSDGRAVGLKLLAGSGSLVGQATRLNKEHYHPLMRNEADAIGHLLPLSVVGDDEAEERKNLKGKLQKFIESGPNLKSRSLTRLNGIIEKIDRILMYATSQKSPPPPGQQHLVDLESASAVGQRNREAFELREMKERRGDSKRRQRSTSARNVTCGSPTVHRETEFSKALSDSAAFNRKVSKFWSEESTSNSTNRSLSGGRGRVAVERLDLEMGAGRRDSLDTIVDGREDFPSEEVLDVESLKSDDTYVVSKDGDNNSGRSNATFVIESEMPPVPKPRTKRLAESRA
ncbi:jouberin-like [Copidosoma floridanum]|uniref:jouberin-like n=1 Tax=Copidosoma floridanum TaxID=29053 RepID=UPI000C6F837C|nr:jouberin-like [Copidosoma floridanum]